jgi:hypothetical protein
VLHALNLSMDPVGIRPIRGRGDVKDSQY